MIPIMLTNSKTCHVSIVCYSSCRSSLFDPLYFVSGPLDRICWEEQKENV